MKFNKIAGAIALLCASSVWAVEPFVIKDIRVEGIQRTEPGTVFSYLPVKVGDTMDDERAIESIHALYATGFFKDVRLEVEHGVLIVQVKERPSIASVEINGVKDFPKNDLKESLKYVGLAEARIFDRGVLDKAIQELKRQYVARGKYGVKVRAEVTNLERNRVGIVFNVDEGEVAKIREINIIGAHAYPEDELLDKMKLSTPDWLSWFTKNDQYSKQKLSADLETIRSFYMDSGFLEFRIDSTQVSISPDKKDVYITINLHEGDKFTVSKVEVSGNTIIPKQEIESMIEVKPGEPFSRVALTDTSKKIGERLGEDGYAFANLNAIPEIDKEKHEVAFNFMIDPGQRVYVRRIDIEGNTKTRDEVIRRELRQMEGAWFNSEKITKSKQRVDRLDYFDEVNVETQPVPGTGDQMDVKVSVKEKSTGNISAGAGFTNNEGIVLSGSVTQTNLFGSGNHVSAQVNTSKINQVYAVSYTNPYYTDDGVSRGFDFYKRNTDSSSTTVSQYTSHTLGGGIRFGVPIGEDDSISYGLSVERTQLGLMAGSPASLVNYVNTFGARNTTVLGSVGWGRDSRDSAIYTTSGTVQRATAEVALPVFDMRYYKLNYQHQLFHPVTDDVTLMLNGEVGVAGGYAGKPMPFFKNFYGGGTGSVRGYEPNSLGPQDATGASLGGTRRVNLGSELLMPMPGLGKDKSVRLSAFVDAGAVYGKGDLPGTAGMRYSVGAAVTWISPMGPLKFSYAVPLNKKPGDKLQKFQFSIGSMF